MIVYAVIVSRLASRLARRRIALHLDADYCTKPLAQVIALTVMCNAVGQVPVTTQRCYDATIYGNWRRRSVICIAYRRRTIGL